MVKSFLPTEETERLLKSVGKSDQDDLLGRRVHSIG